MDDPGVHELRAHLSELSLQVPPARNRVGDNRPAQWPDGEGRRGVSEVEHERGWQCPRHFSQPGPAVDSRRSPTRRETGAGLAAEREGCEGVPRSAAGPTGGPAKAEVQLKSCRTFILESNMCSLALAPGKIYGRRKGV